MDAISPLLLKDSHEAPADFFASICWSLICEPGDSFAGLLISSFGAANSLVLEIEQTSPSKYLSLLREHESSGIERFRSLEKVAADARQRWMPRMNLRQVVEACQDMARLGGWFVTSEHHAWPERLLDLENHVPRGLWGLGDHGTLGALSDAFSFVGSRISTDYGQNTCLDLIEPLVARGSAIVSGGAYGIDAAAHRAAIASGGRTVAMMAGGLDRLYPSGNAELFVSIRKRGALLSEMPPGAEPTKWRFLQRNRLIAASAQSTLVVEAGFKSGARNTATHAASLQRQVFAIPGQINAPVSQGCNLLIANKIAELIQCPSDLLEMAGFADLQQDFELYGLGALETRALDAVGFSLMGTAEIAQLAGLTSNEVRFALATLQLSGLLIQQGSKWMRAGGSTV